MQKVLLTILLLSFATLVSGQNIKENFDAGKRYFDKQEYALAKNSFGKITAIEGTNEMVQWASYYYAISAYYSNDLAGSKNMFAQVLRKYPYWDVSDDVNYWLAFIAAEEQDLNKTIDYSEAIRGPSLKTKSKNLVRQAAASIDDLESLIASLESYPEESIIASRIAEVILSQPSTDENLDLLSDLSDEYELNLTTPLEGINGSPKKSVYNVALFLPFYHRSDSASLLRVERHWTAKLYYGLKLGVEKLRDEGVEINLLTYDTRGIEPLDSIISSGELDSLDLIIGPVTQSSVAKIAPFAQERQINMINPLSANNDVIQSNPFAFLYYPSNESLARRAADYTLKNFIENKNAAIFYSGGGDRARASEYRKIIEQDSFNVVIFEGVRPNESVKIQQLLMEEEELERDSVTVENMMMEMEELREAGEDDWEIYDEQDFVYDTLKILPDSIGHIFIASDYSSLVTSALSGIDARPDSINILTSSRFLAEEQSISLDQLERLDAVLLGSNFIPYDSAAISDFRQRYLSAYMAAPSKTDILGDAYMGYDLMVNFGRLLNRYGKYFQLGLVKNENIDGELIEYFNYRFTRDNNFIPYLKVRDSKIQIRTEEIDEDRPQQ